MSGGTFLNRVSVNIISLFVWEDLGLIKVTDYKREDNDRNLPGKLVIVPQVQQRREIAKEL